MIIDDPGTPGCENWEINVLTDADVSHGEHTYEIPRLDFNYGLGDNIQLKYEVPNIAGDSNGKNVNEIGDSLLGVKIRFYEDESRHVFIGAYPQVEFATKRRGLGGAIATLPVMMSSRVGRTSRGDVVTTSYLGYSKSSRPGEASFVTGGIALGLPLVGSTVLLGEIVTDQALSRIDNQPRDYFLKINLGMIGPIAKSFQAFGSLGRSLTAADHSDHFYALFGVRIFIGD